MVGPGAAASTVTCVPWPAVQPFAPSFQYSSLFLCCSSLFLSSPPLAADDGHAAACRRIHRRLCRALCARYRSLAHSLSFFLFALLVVFFSSCPSFPLPSLAFVRVRVPARGACCAHSAASAALTQLPAALRDRSAATSRRPFGLSYVMPRPSASSIRPYSVRHGCKFHSLRVSGHVRWMSERNRYYPSKSR